MKRISFLYIALSFITTLFAFTDAFERSSFSSGKIAGSNLSIQDTVIPVKVQLEKTTMKDMFILFIADTAKTDEAIQGIFGKDYGELMQCAQQNKLQLLKFMAWYHTTQAPWLMEVAVETNQIPSQVSGRIQSRTQEGGEVIIAHMWGPYDQLGQAYVQLETWLKENNRKAKAAPFEVYINDPAMVKNPSEIQTDIYQLIE
jgi:effector-binding domain-containing protein